MTDFRKLDDIPLLVTRQDALIAIPGDQEHCILANSVWRTTLGITEPPVVQYAPVENVYWCKWKTRQDEERYTVHEAEVVPFDRAAQLFNINDSNKLAFATEIIPDEGIPLTLVNHRGRTRRYHYDTDEYRREREARAANKPTPEVPPTPKPRATRATRYRGSMRLKPTS